MQGMGKVVFVKHDHEHVALLFIYFTNVIITKEITRKKKVTS